MAMMANQIDYDNAMLAWRLLPKKVIDRSNIHHIDTSEPPPLVQLPNVSNQQGHEMPITNLAVTPNTTQHIQSNTVLQHNLQSSQNVSDEGIQVQRPVSNNHLEAHQHHGPVCPYYQQLHANDSTQNRLRKSQKMRVRKRKPPVDGMAYHSRRLGLKVPPKKTLGIKGMVIHNQTREVIHNVYKFMKDEAQNGTKIPISNFRERVLAATGISKCTYSKITSKEFVNGNMVEQALPRRRAPESKTGIKIDDTENVKETDNDNNSLYRPKINRDASTRDGIYNLEELVPARVLLTLESEAIEIINAGNTTNLGLGQFVATNIQKVLESNIFEEVKIRNISIFLYIHYLLKFINTPMRFVKRKHIACEKSPEVNDHILDNFSILGPTGRTRPVHLKDKSLCYIIILAALGIDYEVDLANLAKDCKIGIKKALEVSRILAFNTSSKNKHVVTLKLPLPAPLIFSSKRNRF